MKIILTIVVVLLGVALGCVAWYVLPTSQRFYTDADTIKQPVDRAVTRDILWQPPVRLPDAINATGDDYEPRMSADGLTLFFVRGKAGQNADIFTSSRTTEGWSTPRPLEAVNTEYEELGPEPSADGQSLHFYSDRPGGVGGYDLWVTHRGTDGWRDAVNLGPTVNTGYNEYGPALTPDGETLYFCSNRPRPDDAQQPDGNAWPATVREDLFHRDYDLYTAPISAAGVGVARPIVELNSPYNEGRAAVSPFGDFLYFGSDRPGGAGGFDLYRTRRLGGGHQSPENLGDAVNTASNELDAGLALGGYGLLFSSDRPTQQTDSAGEYDIYYTTSREVFLDAETHQRTIDWAALWSAVGPNLLWALLALLLLLALLALIRGARDRRLSLLARCLLTSVFAHLLLMMLFNFWEVTAGVAHALRGKGAIRVALVSSESDSGITTQIRGGLTEIDIPDTPMIENQRSEETVDTSAEHAMATLTVDRHEQEVHDQPHVNGEFTESTTPAAPATFARHTPARHESPVELTLPEVPDRSNEGDPESREQTAPRSPRASEPAPIALADLHAPATAHLTTLGPEPGNIANAITTGESVTPDPQLREAAPARTMEPIVARTEPSNRGDPVDLTLPVAPNRQAAGTENAKPNIAVPTPESLRSETSTRPGAIAEVSLAKIQPKNREGGFADSTLADDCAPIPADALPTQSRVIGPTTDPIRSLDRVAVNLATLDEAPADASADETRAKLDPARPVSPHGTSVVGSTPVDEARRLAELRPDETATLPTDQQLAPNTADRSSDARPSSHTESLSEALAAPLPPVEAIKLSLLEEAGTADDRDEAAPESSALQPIAPRFADAANLPCKLQPPTQRIVDLPPRDDAVAPRTPSDAISTVEPLPAAAFASYAPKPPTLELARHRLDNNIDREPLFTLPDLRLPIEVAPVENPYAQRAPEQRKELLDAMGGSNDTEQAVNRALSWLAEHQSTDGRWDSDGFDEGCGKCGGETDVEVDIALTGLSLLSFLGANHTHIEDGMYRDTVSRAIDWLLDQQVEDGDLRGHETMYSHGIATIALAEALSMTGDLRLRPAVERAVDFIENARNHRAGGWRYEPGQAGDTSVLGWQVMAVKSARLAGVGVPNRTFEAARDWLDKVSTRRHRGLYAYQPNRKPSPAMTAEGMFVQLVLGRHPHDARTRESAALVVQTLPDWDADASTYTWYYATLALFQRQGPEWSTWNDALTTELLDHQRDRGRPTGSWDPVDEWSNVGGRVYQTAICTLMLEVYYRYLPMYADQPPDDAIGTIRGKVTNAGTGQPLPDADIRLDLPDGQPETVATGADGTYVLFVPQVPEHFALSVSHDGFVPTAADVSAEDIEGTTLELDFGLRPLRDDVIAVEAAPDVHHLGNDQFTGRVNSQFQRDSEGRVHQAEFLVAPNQLPPRVREARVWMLVKGVQCPHRININGRRVAELDDSPRDGSFGEFSASFDAELLVDGTNAITVQAISCNGDLDDFEFINAQIHLSN